MNLALLDKLDIRPILRDHVRTLRNQQTDSVSIADIALFFLIPTVAGIVSAWKDVRVPEVAVNGMLMAFAIFMSLLPSVLVMVLTFLQTTKGDPRQDRQLIPRKLLLREVSANLAFCLLLAIGLVATALVALHRLIDTAAGPIASGLLIGGTATFLLNLLLVLRRLYALVTNEIDRHKFQDPNGGAEAPRERTRIRA